MIKPNNDIFKAALRSKINRVRDIRAAVDEMGETFRSSNAQNFRVGGRFGSDNAFGGGSEKWLPSQRAIEQSGQTLVDRGILRNSLQYDTSGSRISLGYSVHYAKYLHFGAKIPKRKGRQRAKKSGKRFTVLVARPIIVLQNEDLEETRSIMERHIAKSLE